MAKKSVASKKKQSKVKIAKKVTSTKGKRRNAIKSLDVLLSDDEYIKILTQHCKSTVPQQYFKKK